MAVDSLPGLPTIPGPERPKHQIRTLTSRKAGQPIDSPMFTIPVSCLNVIRVSILREPGSFSLFCREERYRRSSQALSMRAACVIFTTKQAKAAGSRRILTRITFKQELES